MPALIIAVTWVGVAAVISCTHKSQELTATVSFKNDIIPIFETSCAISSDCHLGANNANDEISLDSSAAYNTIIAKHLVTGNANTSILYSEVSSGVMPKSPNAPLSSTQIQQIMNWIDQGAINN
jgi:hypothetical protein